MNAPHPSVQQTKELAKRLRSRLAEGGTKIGHAKSLELIAQDHGFRDWNAMFAAIKDEPSNDWRTGDKVQGKYLSHPFTANVISVATVKPGWVRLVLDLDEAIDVVTSDLFFNKRKRIRGVIGPKGHTAERTSDGRPHLEIDLS